MRLTNEGATFTLELSSPITEEEWDIITDVDFDKTDHIYFHTKHGKDVHFYKRRAGQWVEVTNGRGGHECSICHSYAPAWQTGEERLTDYCPNCGARMEVKA